MTVEELQRITEAAIAEKNNLLMFKFKDVIDEISQYILDEVIKVANKGEYICVIDYYNIAEIIYKYIKPFSNKDYENIIINAVKNTFPDCILEIENINFATNAKIRIKWLNKE